MDAVVYIGHGSRLEEGIHSFRNFIENVKKEINIPVQEIAYLEINAPSIGETLENVIQNGAKNILVVPVLLFAAAHYKRDIPEELYKIQTKYPFIQFTITAPFDVHKKMIDLVVKRIQAEAKQAKDGVVLLVGRGSSDPEPIFKLLEISRAVEQKIDLPVDTAFLTAGTPSFATELAKLEEEYDCIYVMPYLLFTGVLLKRVERRIAACAKSVILCGPLQYDERMKEVLIERMQEQFLLQE
ncbi:sirohydrochlorin chelatase [Niallia sp. NCCP-28]|uniref:sirohydrochlorin chelatase n=1 Tax=Niallia sp. NCCP-28 TaxID=2934712 RepID=UPI002087EB7B|nr:sirohydrochlorin chelatase [Niallia sp. NCCP-28]GKU81958.1 cobalamin biosynthesis protein CbiX [Niallia sp. NCCP-28]